MENFQEIKSAMLEEHEKGVINDIPATNLLLVKGQAAIILLLIELQSHSSLFEPPLSR